MELKEKIISLYIDGMSIKKISKELGITHSRVHRILIKNNIPRRSIVHRKYSCNNDVFSKITPESCYWAGFLAADGCIDNHTLKIEISDKDREHLEKLKSFLEFSGDIKTSIKKEKLYVRLNVTSVKIVEDLKNNFGIVPRKTFCLEPPPNVNNENIRHFIRGLIDGDGCIYKNRSIFLVGTEHIVKWVEDEVLKACNISLFLKKCDNSIVWKTGTYGRLQSLTLLKWLYDGVDSTMFLDRKYKASLLFYENPRREKTLVENITKDFIDGKTFQEIRKIYGVGYIKAHAILTEQSIITSKKGRGSKRVTSEDDVI